MKQNRLAIQIATIFIGSIVGAGLSSGRELNQFFAVYGYKSLVGLIICGLCYIIVGKMIVELSSKYQAKSYNEFVDLVCPKWIAIFTNIILTLFLLSSTAIILAGSSAVIHQYFGVPKWIGFLLMVGCSIVCLLKNTKGLFEVNNFTVPFLIITMTCIFFGFAVGHREVMSLDYISNLPYKEGSYIPSSIIYAGFNIISIIGIIVPLTYELKDNEAINKGIRLGTIGLTLVSFFITLLMIINPTYPKLFEIPILAVANEVGKVFQVALLLVIWMEMFSSQISNVYSLTRCLESKFKISYKKGIFLVTGIAAPFSLFGFAKLVEILYPLYGVLSLAFLISCVLFYGKEKITFVSPKKCKHKVSYKHKI